MPYRDPAAARAVGMASYYRHHDAILERRKLRRAANPGSGTAASNRWRVANPERWRATQLVANQRRKDRGKALTDSLKDVPCADCGGRFPPECMDFDHVRGDKTFDVSQMKYKLPEAILGEAAKCEVICANCHRTRTRLRRAGLVDEGLVV